MSACKAGDLGLIPGLGRSPREGKSNPLQYSCLENPMGGGAWWSAVHEIAKSRTRLSEQLNLITDICSCHYLFFVFRDRMSQSLTWRATFCFHSRKPCIDDRKVTDWSEDDAKVLMASCYSMTKFQYRRCPATKSHGFLVEQNPNFRYSLSDILFTLFF